MKIKVLYTQETIGSGGVERRRLNLIRALDKDVYEVKIICTKTEGQIADEMREAGAEVIEVGLLTKIWDIKKYIAVLQVIKSFRPHIIHGAVFEGVLLATIPGWIGGVPVIIAEETSDPQVRSNRASFLLKLITLAADRVIAIAPKVGDYLRNVAKISPAKVRVITNGVSTPRKVLPSEVENLRSSLGIQKEDFIIGSVGRLFDDHKRFTDIIKGLALLKPNKNIKLLLIGEGQDRALIEDVAYQYGLYDNLIMAGYQADVAPFYEIMHIFCLASQREGFGLVVAEAMFHSLPVVATRVGGLQDIVLDNVTGLLVDPIKPEQIAKAFSNLLYNKDLIESMGEKGRIRAEREYSAERYVKDVEALYEELLLEKGIIKSTAKSAALQ